MAMEAYPLQTELKLKTCRPLGMINSHNPIIISHLTNNKTVGWGGGWGTSITGVSSHSEICMKKYVKYVLNLSESSAYSSRHRYDVFDPLFIFFSWFLISYFGGAVFSWSLDHVWRPFYFLFLHGWLLRSCSVKV